MIKAIIDNQAAEVPEGTTILQAARGLGIEIPTLCHLQGQSPLTTCFLCVVKVRGKDNLLPACATAIQEGMVVQTCTPEVLAARRTCLELLFSDHAGDCVAPCQRACPAGMDIPAMLRALARGDDRQAQAVAQSSLVMPAVLGRICPAPCEKACRRAKADSAVAVRMMHCYAAAVDLAQSEPSLPNCRDFNGRRVAIVGAGPAGLSAAFFLMRQGYACTVSDRRELPGGALRDIDPHRLPRDVIDGEVDVLVRMGLTLQLGIALGEGVSLDDLRQDYDAVLLACGPLTPEEIASLGLAVAPHSPPADRATHRTSIDNVFAAGAMLHESKVAVRSVADGHAAAACIDQHLRGEPIVGVSKPFSCHLGQLQEGELQQFLATASPDDRHSPRDGEVCGCVEANARAESLRCLHCDCRKADACSLREHGRSLGADPNHFRGVRRRIEQDLSHSRIVYDSGKCIACGRCVRITESSGSDTQMAFLGRGFATRVGVPFGERLPSGLGKVADECVANCPTGALAFRERMTNDEARMTKE